MKTEEAINRKYLEYVIPNLSVDDFLNSMDKSNRDGFIEGHNYALQRTRYSSNSLNRYIYIY